jgi:YD repeat-containing protein
MTPQVRAEQTALVSHLYAAGLSSEQIARRTGIPARTVLRRLAAAGVTRRTAGDYEVRHYRGPAHPSWRGGIHDATYRRIAFDHYGHSCQRCGKAGKLIVHHRNRDQRDNRLVNLEPLCRSCHLTEHAEDRRRRRLERHAAGHLRARRVTAGR